MIFRTLGLVFTFLLVVGLTIGCGGKEKDETSAKTSHEEHDHSKHVKETSADDPMTHTSAAHTNMGGTMGLTFTSTMLYTCPMHADVISAESSTPCPLCKMDLQAMDDIKYQELLKSKPKGCPMCAIVVEGKSSTNACPVCKMDLKKIEDHRGHNH